MKKFALILVLIFCFTRFLSGKSPLVTNYRLNNGLPSNLCDCVIQDSKGFLWFGTDAGAIRYDGTSFVVFSKKDGLDSNHIVRIKEDIEGRVWFMFFNGELNYFYKNHIHNQENTPFLREVKTDFLFHNFFQDTDSTIYFYNNASEIYVVKNNKYINYSSNDIKGRGLFNISKNSNNNLLLWETNQIKEIKTLDKVVKTYKFDFKIRRAYTMKNGLTYVFGSDGYIHLFNDAELLKRNIVSLPASMVNDILEDDGCLWVSTFDEGIFCFKNDSMLLHLDIEKAQNLTIDNQNYIWTASSIYGIYKIDKNILKYKTIGSEYFDNLGIRDIAPANDNGLWVSNRKSVFWVDKNHNPVKLSLPCSKQLLPNGLTYMHQMRNNDIILHGYLSFIVRIANVKVDSLSEKITHGEVTVSHRLLNIRKLAIDSTESNLYFFLNNYAGLINYETNNQLIKKFKRIGKISNILIDRNNELLVNARYNCCLNFSNKYHHNKIYDQFNGEIISANAIVDKNREFFLINKEDIFLVDKEKTYDVLKGLKKQIDFKINKIYYYRNTLIFNTVKTIYYISNPLSITNGKKLKINQLNINFNNINDICCMDNTIYVASDNGLTNIPFKDFFYTTQLPTKPYFANVFLDGSKIDMSADGISYKNKKRLTIQFSSLNFSPSPSEYSYKLEGQNNEWITGKEKQVTFFNLKPGHYVFRLKSRRNSGKYSNVIELPIVVVPNFYQLLVTRIAAGLLVLLLIFFAFRLRYMHIIKLKEKDNQLITLENRALQSQMNPHFIFNSLGSIQKFLLQNKSEEAGNYLSQFARLIRQTLNATKSNSVLLDEEVDRLRNYIELEQFRMDNRFFYNIDIDEKFSEDNYRIPSMLIQPFVENAIWHGISSLPGKGIISISFIYINEEKLRVVVEDNGIGFEKSKAFSKTKHNLNMASEITKKRLQLIGEKCNVKTKLSVSDLLPGEENPGTKITLVIPVM